LLTGGGAAAEQPFLEHYRALLQTDPAVAMAHAAALRALQALPAEAENQSERLHARTNGTNDDGSCAWDNADEAHPDALMRPAASQPGRV